MTAFSGDAVQAVHPYPCSFPGSTARAYLSGGGVFLDPFCGSGTAVLEASLHGSFDQAIGVDCNPIGLLIARCKTLNTSSGELDAAEKLLVELRTESLGFRTSRAKLPGFRGRDHWFSPQVAQEIAAILEFMRDRVYSDFESTWLRCALSTATEHSEAKCFRNRVDPVTHELENGRNLLGDLRRIWVRRDRENPVVSRS